MKIDVVIPNYNGNVLLRENLPKVIASCEQYNSSIIIVDDGSDKEEFDNVAKIINELHSKNILLVRNEKNLGFSSTVNKGVAQSNADFVVLLNTDVIPENNFLEAALKDLEMDKNLFGVGFMDKSIEDDKTVLRGRGLGAFKRGFVVHNRGEVNKEDTFWISGGSSIVRRDIFKKLSGFDTIYDPFYWKDIDLSYRARKSGFTIRFEPKSAVVHKHSEGAIRKNFTDFKVKKIAYRNQLIFVWKNITDFSLLISHILWLPFHVITAALRFDRAFIVGFLLAVIKVPDIIIKRSEQRKLYKVSDSDLLKDQ